MSQIMEPVKIPVNNKDGIVGPDASANRSQIVTGSPRLYKTHPTPFLTQKRKDRKGVTVQKIK